MSKPLVVSDIVSPAINIHTTDNSGAVVLDQAEALNNIVTVRTNALAKNIRLTNDSTVEVKLTGGDIFLTASNGNVSSSASQVLEFGAGFVFQTMLTVGNVGALNPANALYNELNNTDIPTLRVLSRVNINPAALGTTVNSLFIDAGNPNIDGREIWIQNIGTAAGQTLTLNNLSGAGTVGGLFRTPVPAFAIPAGGGVSIMFDSGQNEWLVRSIG